MVLDVRKMEVGESKLQIQPYALNQWIEHVSQDFVSEGEAKTSVSAISLTHRSIL